MQPMVADGNPTVGAFIRTLNSEQRGSVRAWRAKEILNNGVQPKKQNIANACANVMRTSERKCKSLITFDEYNIPKSIQFDTDRIKWSETEIN